MARVVKVSRASDYSSIVLLYSNATMEGWGYKKRTRHMPAVYQRRYFRIDEGGATELIYSKKPSDVKARGSIAIKDIRRIYPTDSSDLGKGKLVKQFGAFSLSMSTSDRTYHIMFEDELSYDQWLLAIWKLAEQDRCILSQALQRRPGISAATRPKQLAAEPVFAAVPAPAVRQPEQDNDGGSSRGDPRETGPSSSSAADRNPWSSPGRGGGGPRGGHQHHHQQSQQLSVDFDDGDDDELLSGDIGNGGNDAGADGGEKKSRSLFSLFSKGGGKSDESSGTDIEMREGPLKHSAPTPGRGRGGRGGRGAPPPRGRGRGRGAPRGAGRGGPASGRGAPRGMVRGRGGPRGRGRGGAAGLGQRLLDSDDDGSEYDSEDSDSDDESGSYETDSDDDSDDDSDEEKDGSEKGGCCVVM